MDHGRGDRSASDGIIDEKHAPIDLHSALEDGTEKDLAHEVGIDIYLEAEDADFTAVEAKRV
jgi:hypothetical protein